MQKWQKKMPKIVHSEWYLDRPYTVWHTDYFILAILVHFSSDGESPEINSMNRQFLILNIDWQSIWFYSIIIGYREWSFQSAFHSKSSSKWSLKIFKLKLIFLPNDLSNCSSFQKKSLSNALRKYSFEMLSQNFALKIPSRAIDPWLRLIQFANIGHGIWCQWNNKPYVRRAIVMIRYVP